MHRLYNLRIDLQGKAVKFVFMKKNKSENRNLKNATMDLKGARCASCVYTIEHVGRKIKGIEDIKVDAGKGEIHVIYDGDPSSLDKITDVIGRLGYSAALRGKWNGG